MGSFILCATKEGGQGGRHPCLREGGQRGSLLEVADVDAASGVHDPGDTIDLMDPGGGRKTRSIECKKRSKRVWGVHTRMDLAIGMHLLTPPAPSPGTDRG